jgi:uncharacterized protein
VAIPGVIDFHAHVYPEDLAPKILSATKKSQGVPVPRSGLAADLRQSMMCSGIIQSVLLPMAKSPEAVPGYNDWACSVSGDGLTSLGTVYPAMPDLEGELDRIRSSMAPGIKIMPIFQKMYPDDPMCDRLYEALIERDMLVVAHAGREPVDRSPDFGSPERFAQVVNSYPELKLVLAHLGGLRMWDDVHRHLLPLMSEENGLYFDTSYASFYLTVEEMTDIIKEAGSDRILFGTDYPWAEAGHELDIIGAMDLSRSEKEAILYGNASRLLGIPQAP